MGSGFGKVSVEKLKLEPKGFESRLNNFTVELLDENRKRYLKNPKFVEHSGLFLILKRRVK